MPGLPVPFHPEPAVSFLSVRGNNLTSLFASDDPNEIGVTVRLARDVTIQSAVLRMPDGGEYPMERRGDELVVALADENYTPGRASVSVSVLERSHTRNFSHEFLVVLSNPVSSKTFTYGGGLRTKDEKFSTPVRVALVRPVVFAARASFSVVPTYSFFSLNAATMQASRRVVLAGPAARRPADHYLTLLREEDELLVLGLLDRR